MTLTFAFSAVDRKSKVSFGAAVAVVTFGVMVTRLVAGLPVLGALAMSVTHAVCNTKECASKYLH